MYLVSGTQQPAECVRIRIELRKLTVKQSKLKSNVLCDILVRYAQRIARIIAMALGHIFNLIVRNC